jgi:hypothetical protein
MGVLMESPGFGRGFYFFISNTSISGWVELMRILDLQDWRGVEWVLQIDRFFGERRKHTQGAKAPSCLNL